jgi:hypothetical protein
MTVEINRVETEIDVTPPAPAASVPAAPADAGLKERLRPVVLEILREELERLRRRQG